MERVEKKNNLRSGLAGFINKSVQLVLFLDRLGRRGNMRDDSAEIPPPVFSIAEHRKCSNMAAVQVRCDYFRASRDTLQFLETANKIRHWAIQYRFKSVVSFKMLTSSMRPNK